MLLQYLKQVTFYPQFASAEYAGSFLAALVGKGVGVWVGAAHSVNDLNGF